MTVLRRGGREGGVGEGSRNDFGEGLLRRLTSCYDGTADRQETIGRSKVERQEKKKGGRRSRRESDVERIRSRRCFEGKRLRGEAAARARR